MDMKRITVAATIAVLFTALAAVAAFGQNAPLGDYARQVRKQKQQQAPPVKSYDNYTIPRDDKLSVVGQAPPENPDANSAVSGEAAAEAKAAAGAPEAAPVPPGKQNAPPQPVPAEKKKPPAEEQAEKQKILKEWKT